MSVAIALLLITYLTRRVRVLTSQLHPPAKGGERSEGATGMGVALEVARQH